MKQKNAKKNKNVKNVNSEFEMGNLFKIILIILVVFGIFYVLTYYLQKNKNNNGTYNNINNSIAIIQYDEILIGNILKQSESEYYVLLVKEEDYNERFKKYLASYSNNKKIYYSLIDNGLNKNYISDTSNLKVDEIKDLKVNTTSLLKIESGKIAEVYDGNAAVMEFLIDINK